MIDYDIQDTISEIISTIQRKSFYMLQSLSTGNLKDCLSDAQQMISQLQCQFPPKKYYQIFLHAVNHLNELKIRLSPTFSSEKALQWLYQRVQYTQKILPRLYLLITIGSLCIEQNLNASIQIFQDMVELSKGVQNPIRGLFLRYYLNQTCKSLSLTQNLQESVDFLLKNLSQMNKLWVRMSLQHSEQRRQQNRKEIKVTIGENLVRISCLEGVSVELYKIKVLPKVMEIMVNSRDHLSQSYLLDCIIHVFSDEFHLNTLDTLMQIFLQLQQSVEVIVPFTSMLNRLTDYVQLNRNNLQLEGNICQMINVYVQQIQVVSLEKMGSFLELQLAFLKLGLTCYQGNTQHASRVFAKSKDAIRTLFDSVKVFSMSFDYLAELLFCAIQFLSVRILEVEWICQLMENLKFATREKVVSKIVEEFLLRMSWIKEEKYMSYLVRILKPLGGKIVAEGSLTGISQVKIAGLVQLVEFYSLEGEEILNCFSEFVRKIEVNSSVISCSLVFSYLKYITKMKHFSLQSFQIVIQIIGKLASQHPYTGLQLYIQSILCCNFLEKTEEQQQFLLNLAELSIQTCKNLAGNSVLRLESISSIIGAFFTVKIYKKIYQADIISSLQKWCGVSLGRIDQCHVFVLSTHLFRKSDSSSILTCLRRSVKIAQMVSGNTKHLQLFVSILNKYLCFYLQGSDFISEKIISNLIELIQQHLKSAQQDYDMNKRTVSARVYLSNTLSFISFQKQNGYLLDVSIQQTVKLEDLQNQFKFTKKMENSLFLKKNSI